MTDAPEQSTRPGLRIRVPFIGGDRRVRVSLPSGLVVAGACVLVAYVWSLIFKPGHHTDASYYGTVAQVIPIFLLAFMVEVRARLDRSWHTMKAAVSRLDDHVEAAEVRVQKAEGASQLQVVAANELFTSATQHRDEVHQDLRTVARAARRVVRAYVAVAVPGEAASLWALSAGHGSGFAVSLGATSLVAMTALYVRSLGIHYDD